MLITIDNTSKLHLHNFFLLEMKLIIFQTKVKDNEKFTFL